MKENFILSLCCTVIFPFVLILGQIKNNSSESVSQISVDNLLIQNSKQLACASNEHWLECNAHCQKTCANKNKETPCAAVCVSGCVCNDGLVRDLNDSCISPNLCRISEKMTQQNNDEFCPPKEKFSICNAHCQRNCSNWSDHTLPCLKVCVPGCTCKNGKVRGPHGTCISPRQCPPRNTYIATAENVIECPTDEHFVNCEAHCQKNCSTLNQNSTCSDICIPGCVCDNGYVRNNFGKCILTESCQVEKESHFANINTRHHCPHNERKTKYQSLPNSEKYCLYGSDSIDMCPRTFLRGCVCKRNLVRGADMKCIEPRLLPHTNELTSIFDNNADNELRRSGTTRNINLEMGNSLNTDQLQVQRQEAEDGSGGCPNFMHCTQWCKNLNYNLGVCAGKKHLRCICIQ